MIAVNYLLNNNELSTLLSNVLELASESTLHLANTARDFFFARKPASYYLEPNTFLLGEKKERLLCTHT